MKKIILFFTVIIQFVSCNYFETPTQSRDEVVEKRLKEINWKTVDTNPSIFGCETIKDKQEQKKCFFDYMTQTISEKLNPIISKSKLKIYPIQIRVTVLQDSTTKFEYIKDTLNLDKTKIDSLLKTKLADFSKIIPATKRGIIVKSQFIIPSKITL